MGRLELEICLVPDGQCSVGADLEPTVVHLKTQAVDHIDMKEFFDGNSNRHQEVISPPAAPFWCFLAHFVFGWHAQMVSPEDGNVRGYESPVVLAPAPEPACPRCSTAAGDCAWDGLHRRPGRGRESSVYVRACFMPTLPYPLELGVDVHHSFEAPR